MSHFFDVVVNVHEPRYKKGERPEMTNCKVFSSLSNALLHYNHHFVTFVASIVINSQTEKERLEDAFLEL